MRVLSLSLSVLLVQCAKVQVVALSHAQVDYYLQTPESIIMALNTSVLTLHVQRLVQFERVAGRRESDHLGQRTGSHKGRCLCSHWDWSEGEREAKG